MNQVLNKYEIDKSLETENAKEKYIGKVFQSRASGDFKVVGVHNIRKNKNLNFVIEFIETGNQSIVSSNGVISRTVKDVFAKTVRGVGFVGNYKGEVKKNRFYQTWKLLLDRCFPTEHREKHPTYENCTICDDWLCFDEFQRDCQELIGYEQKLEYPHIDFQLDKDILLHNNKHYNKENCIWLPQKLNSFFTNINSRNKTGFEGVSQTKHKNYATCISIDGKTRYIASSKTPFEAYLKYCKVKSEVLEMYLTDEFVFLDERIKEALRNKLISQREERISNYLSKKQLTN